MTEQFRLFAISVAAGLGGGFVYGLISIFRRYISHNIIGIYIEDFLFWIIYSVFAFLTMLYFNYGEIRPYIVAGIFLGLIIYALFIHRFAVFMLSPTIKILRLIAEIILTPVELVLFPFKKIFIISKKYLKNNVKYERIKKPKVIKFFKRGN